MDLVNLVLVEGKAIILLNDDNKKLFLKDAKRQGFKWIGGKEIDENDNCFYHILVNKNNISNISTMSIIKDKNLKNLKKIDYINWLYLILYLLTILAL